MVCLIELLMEGEIELRGVNVILLNPLLQATYPTVSGPYSLHPRALIDPNTDLKKIDPNHCKELDDVNFLTIVPIHAGMHRIGDTAVCVAAQ